MSDEAGEALLERPGASEKSSDIGDVFFAGYPERRSLTVGAGTWPVPAGARTVPTREDPTGIVRSGVFATPAAVRGAGLRDAFVYAYLRTDVAGPTPTRASATPRPR